MNEPYNPELRRAIYQVVNNQLKANDPPETRQTLERLQAEGHSKDEAMRLIATVVLYEIYDLLKLGRPYDRDRFVAALHALPTLESDESDTASSGSSGRRKRKRVRRRVPRSKRGKSR